MSIIRVRHPKGVLKIELPIHEISALWIYEQVSKELASFYPEVDSFFISLGNEATSDSRLDPNSRTLLNLSHGQLLYLHIKSAKKSSSPDNSFCPDYILDHQLQKMDGKIKRSRDSRLCRHGSAGMCENCQPLEPYDSKYLEEKGIKHLSFYSWLKKLRDSNNAAVPITSLLETPCYTVNLSCPYHAPFPEAICTKCQPSTIILRQQPFRMVDHVEFSSPRLIDEFLSGWRNTGFQRFGWLIGKYEMHTDQVPLGIKAVAEIIYEPPQDGSIDGFQLVLSEMNNGIDARHESIFKEMNLQVVGMIYTDLIDDASGTGKVVLRRSRDSFFVSSSEVLFIAHQQAIHPFHYSGGSQVKLFSSRFSSVVISGEADGGIGLKAYQVSESAVAMEEANLIAATTDPSQMMVRSVDEGDYDINSPLYVPQVFYKFKNEYGIEVQKAADPLFPVEYLLVTLSEGIPLKPDPIFKSPLSFPSPQLHPSIKNLIEYFGDTLHLNSMELAVSNLLSNANLLFFLAQAGFIPNESERLTICKAILLSNYEALSNFITSSETWKRVLSAVSESMASDLTYCSSDDTWICKHCTFVNQISSGQRDCSMCGLPSQ